MLSSYSEPLFRGKPTRRSTDQVLMVTVL